jgi:hypothetical protein
MANLQQGNSTAEYIPVPTLFRSVFAGRPVPGYPKDYFVPAKEKEPEEENLLKEASEENNVEDESEESDEDDQSNESRIKKNASSDESESDEDDSDEDESDEDDSDEDKDEKKSSSEAGNTIPSRWRQTRYGSSFRIQAVGRPISYAHHGYGNPNMNTPKY